MSIAHPTGIGFYARTLSEATHGTPKAMAAKLRDHGATWVAFLACWQDRSGPGKTFAQREPRRAVHDRYVEACAAAGLDVWLWGFPWLGRETEYLEAMRRHVTPAIRGFLHDPEVSYRDKRRPPPKGSRGQADVLEGDDDATETRVVDCARALIHGDAALVAELGLRPSGITSYGVAQYHALPWAQLSAGGAWGSPQLYTVGPELVDAGLAGWKARGFDVLLPSVGTYGENSGAKLDAHLARFVDSGNEPTIDGFAVWSYQQTGGVEWKTLARWAEMLRAKACVAPAPLVV